MGLKDQVQALKWIQQYIEAFGGDKSRVTIFGGNSGAADVVLHMLSPMSKGLFHRAISQSGNPMSNCNFARQPIREAKMLATEVGCPMDTKEHLLECFKEMDASQLIMKMKKWNMTVS